MSTTELIFAPATHALRPERKRRKATALEKFVHRVGGWLRTPTFDLWRLQRIVKRVKKHDAEMSALSDEEILQLGRELRLALRRDGFKESHVARAFAMIREVAGRVLGKRHYDCQLVGAWVMVNGMVAEMNTGEGKTLTATLAAGTAALAGIPVHVITVNDYLAERDAEEMRPVYESIGLTVSYVVHEVKQANRRVAYAADITYCTNKELVFDYLRDRLVLGEQADPLTLQTEYLHSVRDRTSRLLLRGLHFAIVDEADSVLIDESRTPLVISQSVGSEDEEEFLRQVMKVAEQLEHGHDYKIIEGERRLELLEEGKEHLEEIAPRMGPFWTGAIRREDMVKQALTALYLFDIDIHYLVREGKVEIVDEFTGRVMADRSWERGLHQLMEIKEGCKITQQRIPVARISYQRFFRRYLNLSGMTGTAEEVVGELWSVYDLPVVRVPTNRPLIRTHLKDRIHLTAAARWQALIQRIRDLHEDGRPVLVGTRSVAASEHVSRLLSEAGLEHAILNAKRDKEEALVVEKAGESGRVTIATNMAGRGTDIKLGAGVVDKGGLLVILTERHDAGRVDRQLAGRCGRQGDPGVFEPMLSIEDHLLDEGGAWFLRGLARWFLRLRLPGGAAIGRMAFRVAQRRVERFHAQIRNDLLEQDEKWGDLMSFSGRIE